MSVSIRFCGAARTVTGSRHLISLGRRRILVDCGLFQGSSEIRRRNWEPFPVPPDKIDAVVLTHAHLDHIGYLPRLVREGYSGPIYATHATVALARISMPDSGRLQLEQARFLNKKGLTRHEPALPLYTEADAYACLKQFVAVPYGKFHELPGKAIWRYLPAGHILGSAFAEVYFPNGERILMSGDLGRYDTPILKDPACVDHAEYLVLESTYGNRIHSNENVEEKLASVLGQAVRESRCVLVPSFSIGRTQEMLYYIKRVQASEGFSRLPIFLDSPMASDTTIRYLEHTEEHDIETRIAIGQNDNPIAPANLHYVADYRESKKLNTREGPFVVIAGSGMCTGGRIVHHLANRLGRSDTTVLFTGYQAEGTLGRQILERNPVVRVLGQEIQVKATIEKLNALSAHADQAEILKWLGCFQAPPRRTFIVHGEPESQETLRDKIVEKLGWEVVIPEHLQQFDL
ncbi:MAG: MBL fold metallo-hydrolase [Fimbriimonadaceae bacterium]|nr:MBL fold metallo-hydrolase [Fimbriimonadaceae bacterium]QOJ12845.1 MAG: MBL fold metallo-hydrolase [Chthonomonadaceae bacterium]